MSATAAFAPAAVLAGALALDVAFGEPPAALHPVVWMGRLASALERLAPLVRDCSSFGLPDHIRVAVRPPGDCARLVQALAREARR